MPGVAGGHLGQAGPPTSPEGTALRASLGCFSFLFFPSWRRAWWEGARVSPVLLPSFSQSPKCSGARGKMVKPYYVFPETCVSISPLLGKSLGSLRTLPTRAILTCSAFVGNSDLADTGRADTCQLQPREETQAAPHSSLISGRARMCLYANFCINLSLGA